MFESETPQPHRIVATLTCVGCMKPFGEHRRAYRVVPHEITFNEEEQLTRIDTAYPLCEACLRRWVTDEQFELSCDRRASAWITMDAVLAGYRNAE